jgi:hypothetical protein
VFGQQLQHSEVCGNVKVALSGQLKAKNKINNKTHQITQNSQTPRFPRVCPDHGLELFATQRPWSYSRGQRPSKDQPKDHTLAGTIRGALKMFAVITTPVII